jgi:hypothetical protein
VKLSPAIDLAIASEFDGEFEFLSEAGECKEALLKLGAFRSGAGTGAFLIDRNLRINAAPGRAPLREKIGAYLYEPDPAIIRAGLTNVVASETDGWLISSDIAYVLSDRLVHSPLAASYRIHTNLPFRIKHLESELNSRDVGRVIVKKRGAPQEPEEVRKQLKLKGSLEAVVILARLGKQIIAMIGEEVKQ